MRKVTPLNPAGRALLIGSQPLYDHAEACARVLASVPEIPNWAQLPLFPAEGMLVQFADGLPGLMRQADQVFVDTAAEGLDSDLADFYETYLKVVESDGAWDTSPFVLTPRAAPGFFTMLQALEQSSGGLFAVKGQITGPFTFTTGIKDQQRRALFYHETLRDAAVKLVALKAAWQVRQLRKFGAPVIIFIDEPALAGYGSSEFISISREDISACLREVIEAVHEQGGAAGVHVCANTDWSLLLELDLDIVNFDAFGYFDKLLLYGAAVRGFLESGGCLAWGLVPTAPPAEIEAADVECLFQLWERQSAAVAALGVDSAVVRRRAFITPSCGTGSLTDALSRKVLELTRALSLRIRQQ